MISYLCGYQAGNAVEGLTGIRAYLQTQTADALTAFPAGGDLASVVALQVQDTGAPQPLLLRLGYGLFRLNAAMTPTAYLFSEMLAGGQRALRLLGQPGTDGEFHSYAAGYDPSSGSWSLLVDGLRVGTLQAEAWKDTPGTVSTRQLVPGFLAGVSVIEAPVLGSAKSPVEVEAAQLRIEGQYQDQSFATPGTGAGAVVWQSVAEVGQIGAVPGYANAFTLSPKAA